VTHLASSSQETRKQKHVRQATVLLKILLKKLISTFYIEISKV